MTKYDYAVILVNSPAWDGSKSISLLIKKYTKQELKDAYDMMKASEEDYFSEMYGK